MNSYKPSVHQQTNKPKEGPPIANKLKERQPSANKSGLMDSVKGLL